ncbi:MAG: TetR family transcriptional regulator, partial [Nocardioidaceae bacterium]
MTAGGRPARRPYASPRRREQAQITRADIAAAARRLFMARGWAGTRVRDVAAEAGV